MNAAPSTWYSKMFFSDRAIEIMKAGNILPADGTPAGLLADLTSRLAQAETRLGEDESDTDQVIADFYDYVRSGICILGSPLLTNIAVGHTALGSCAAAPINVDALSTADLGLAAAYYRLNMGSGYDLTSASDPCAALVRLNEHAEEPETSATCERYIGNIAHISVDHPRVLEFVELKTERDDLIHFNTSIDMNERFMRSVVDESAAARSNGVAGRARHVWDAIVEAAWQCGDPGLISLERYNADNALADDLPYVTTAPCAEVGLSPGESCVFGYINLAACIRLEPLPSIDFELVGAVARCLTRVLDDALEDSLAGFPVKQSASVVAAKRKIGIGLCGFADALMWLGVDYGNETSARLLGDVLAVINHRSKLESLALAQRRGRFPMFNRSRYSRDGSFLSRFKGVGTVISEADWDDLSERVATHGLRNVMTSALPPSGRSARLLGVNPSIEPFLDLRDGTGHVPPVRGLLQAGRAVLAGDGAMVTAGDHGAGWPHDAATRESLFRTSEQITPEEHFRVLKVAAGAVDDGVSKTINLAAGSSREQVDRIFRTAWHRRTSAPGPGTGSSENAARRPGQGLPPTHREYPRRPPARATAP